MRERLLIDRRTMEEHLLPPEAQTTELDHRTQPTTPAEDRAWARHVVVVQTVAFLVAGLVLQFAACVPLWITSIGFGLICAVRLGAAAWYYLASRPWMNEVTACGLVAIAWAFHAYVRLAPTPVLCYLLLFGPAVLSAQWFAGVVARQVAFWMTANPRVPYRTLRRFRRYWPLFNRRDGAIARFVLGTAYTAGLGVCLVLAGTTAEITAAFWGVLTFGVVALVLDCCLPVPGQVGLSRTTLCRHALAVFLAYNRKFETEAAGVFRFPDAHFQSPVWRVSALALVIALGAAACLAAAGVAGASAATRNGPAPRSSSASGLTAAQEAYANELPPEVRARYRQAVRRENGAGATTIDRVSAFAGDTLHYAATRAVFCVFAPYAVLVVVMRIRVGRALAVYYSALEAPNATAVSQDASVWDNLVGRILNSRNEKEREHVLIGFTTEDDVPMLVARDILDQNVECYGGPGAGKTAAAIAPVVAQLIARGDCSVLLIDLKRDMQLFHTANHEAARAGFSLRRLTNVVGLSSHAFNPLTQTGVELLTLNQLTEGIAQALSLKYGPGGDDAFFGAMNETLLSYYLRNRDIRSFAELAAALSDPSTYRPGFKRDLEHSRHVFALVEKLAGVTPLNAVRAGEDDRPELFANAIDLPTLLDRPQVVYFGGNAVREEEVTAMIGKLILFALLSAASGRATGARVEVYVFVDEFPVVVSDNLRLFLAESRSMGVHFFAASQTRAQLKRNRLDISEVVDSTTFMKWEFHPHDAATLRRIHETSPVAGFTSLSWSRYVDASYDVNAEDGFSLAEAVADQGPVSVGVSRKNGVLPDRNTVIATGTRPQAGLVWLREHRGFTACAGKWVPIVSPFHITRKQVKEREQLGWPAVGPDTLEVLRDAPDLSPVRRNTAIDTTMQQIAQHLGLKRGRRG